MLPYLKAKKDGGSTGLIVKSLASNETPEDQDDPAAGHLACAHALISAVKAGDAQGVADALQDAFEIMDSMPHEEDDHSNPHSYNAQNQLAAKDIE